MGLDISFDIILAYASGPGAFIFHRMAAAGAFKTHTSFLFNAILGGIALWLINTAGKFIGISVAINPVTALTVGFLGIPGLILILLLQYVIL